MRKIRVNSVIFICGLLLHLDASGQEGESYVKTASGIEITIQHAVSGIKKIRLQPVSDQIIHVTEIAGNGFPEDHSLMAVRQNNPSAWFLVKEEQGQLLR
jgi:alpha-D-xyloside xylohydrolase